MLSLLGGSYESMLEGARHLSALPIRALKLHQLQLVRGTALARHCAPAPGQRSAAGT
jgi:hypothetical protein